jgi:hypothetical protein
MKPAVTGRVGTEQPFEVTIIQRPAKAIAEPRPIAPSPALAVRRRASPPRTDALQAVVTAPSIEPTKPSAAVPPQAWWYGSDGKLRVPEAFEPPRRAPWARPRASNALPGADSRGNAPEVRASRSPQQWVELVGGIFGGGHYDSCPQIESEMSRIDDPDARDRAYERYEAHCQ